MRRGKSLLLGLLWQMSTVRMHPEALRRRRILLLRRRILRSLWLSNRTCLGQTLYMIIGCRDARRAAHPLNKATLCLGQLGVNFLDSENRRVLQPPREGGLLRRLGARSPCYCCLDPTPPLRGGGNHKERCFVSDEIFFQLFHK